MDHLNTISTTAGDEHSHHHTNKIQISNTKKPLFFYVNLAKQFLGAHETVHLSGLGMAVATVVTVAEILKKNGLAAVTSIGTSTVDMVDETNPDNEVTHRDDPKFTFWIYSAFELVVSIRSMSFID